MRLIILLILVSCLPLRLFGRLEENVGERTYISPNGRYSVRLKEIDRIPHFVIADLASGREDESIIMPTVLLYLHWSTDSKAIVTVEHIAKGSYGRVIYQSNKTWLDREIHEPGHRPANAHVTKLTVGARQAQYEFTVGFIAPNGAHTDATLCHLDVNLADGKIRKSDCQTISLPQLCKRLEKQPVYVPEMEHTD